MSEQERSAGNEPEMLIAWGQQTIFFAMSLHAMDVGKPIDNPQGIRAAGAEGERISQELWETVYNAAAEHHDPVGIKNVTMPFARKVLDWAADHLGYSAV